MMDGNIDEAAHPQSRLTNLESYVMTILADLNTGLITWSSNGTVLNSVTYKPLTEGNDWFFTLCAGANSFKMDIITDEDREQRALEDAFDSVTYLASICANVGALFAMLLLSFLVYKFPKARTF